ncbi:pseudouridine synthase [Ectothiorhodospiraceae bacterium WFHF3C12]|nr:pseudouridine synthase [Ectothiorhodospiraceae bacterium WFHF3C12]
MTEKLQKVLARAGVGSRREMERWISEGRVQVNGRPATLGARVDETARITVDGRPLGKHGAHGPRRRVVAYYKRAGEVTTRSDPDGRPTVFDRLPPVTRGRWIAVGRLDVDTLGLLLFTTDGELANRLMHPSHELPREYAVRVFGEVTPEIIARLTRGVTLEDGEARFESVQPRSQAEGEGANEWYHVVLRRGRRREVRRLWESQGLTVSRLIRVRYGPVSLPRGLRRGDFRELNAREVGSLAASVGLQPRPEDGPPPQRRRQGGRRRR